MYSKGAIVLSHKGPVYMRIGNGPIPVLWEEPEFIIGQGTVLNEGADVAIISTGSATARVLEAAEFLRNQNISVMVVGMPTVNPIDEALIQEIAKKRKVFSQ